MPTQAAKPEAETPPPFINILDPEKERQLPAVRARLTEIQKKMDARAASAETAFHKWIADTEQQLKNPLPLPNNALLHFPLQAGKGNKISDTVDPKRTGEIKGKAQWIKARGNQGLKLDGNTYIDLGNVANFERTDSFSYGAWVWGASKTAGAVLARIDDGSKHRGYDLYIGGDGKTAAHIIHEWPTNAVKVISQKSLLPYEWNHVFVTYDGSSKATGVKIYVNGELWPTTVETDALTKSIRTQKSLRIGSRDPGSRFNGKVDEIRMYARALSAAEVQAIAKQNPLDSILAVERNKRSNEQQQQLRNYYLEHVDAEYRTLTRKHQSLKAAEADLLKPVTTVMIMRDQTKPRDTFMLARGAYNAPTEHKVQPGTPLIFPPMAKGLPANRLGMARWLFQDNHPLTARVAVNRYWQMLFGTGFVATPEDFGSQGEFPSHVELLDWLAVDFRNSGWNVKRMLKQIVMSATYRQSSKVSAESARRDPTNRLLARGARFRLQSEFIRDNVLALSGLMVNKMGGPGVKPYQPPGLWKEVGLGGKPVFVQDRGENLYRRSIYTYWKRSAPPPNMQLFDAPTREKCTVRRPRTNTPLQALVLLNDVQFVEAARSLAERILKEAPNTDKNRATFAFESATARKPSKGELNVLIDLLQHAKTRYQSDVEAARKLIGTGESPRDEKLDPKDHAAWTVVASTILNLDEVLTRE